MTKDVMVHIRSLQEGADGEVIETKAPGTYYFKEDRHYVFYEEKQEGFSEGSKCQLRLKGMSCLEVLKKGLSNMHMILEENRQTSTIYATPYGQFALDIRTERLTVKETDTELFISVLYAMDAAGSPITKNEMEISIQAV